MNVHAHASPSWPEGLRPISFNQMANGETQVLDRAFAACAQPIRRGSIERLGIREMTVGEATHGFAVSKPAISRHLRVLEEAGAIVRVIDGRTHRLRLTAGALDEAHDWIRDQRLDRG